MLRRILLTALAAAAVLSVANSASAHFLWLVRPAGEPIVHVYFAEEAAPDDPALLDKVASAKIWRLTAGAEPQELKATIGKESLEVPLDKNADAASIFILKHDYGVINRGDKSMRLQYFAKTGPVLGGAAWVGVDTSKLLPLDITAAQQEGKVLLTVLAKGKPLAGSQVTVLGPGLKKVEANTGDQGRVSFTPADKGLYSIRARHIDATPGELDGKKYGDDRAYVTLSLTIGGDAPKNTTAASDKPAASASSYPAMPEPVTSFGAAIIKDNVYVYGGHLGAAHNYHNQSQSTHLWRLNLAGAPEWKKLATGPALQGLAMVAIGDQLVRLGGFIAKNKEGDEGDLHSQKTVESFSLKTGKWSALPELPEGRSSFDAAVDGQKIYVVGGWSMAGKEEAVWHKTAWVLDLASDKLAWKALPEAPFQRRALSLAMHDGKLYCIGGMQPKGSPVVETAIYDPAADKWSAGPAIPGKGMEGFGTSSFAQGGKLYVSTISGALLKLSDDAQSWDKVEQLARDRFFHRMLPVGSNNLLMVGGASMGTGKFAEVDLVEVR